MLTSFNPQKILVTGGAGFIGSNFIHYLTSHPAITSIVNLDSLTYAGNLNNLQLIQDDPRYHFYQGDINDQKLVTHILQHYDIDTIVHFAAESHVDRSISEPATFIMTNIVGTFNLLECARNVWLNSNRKQQCRFHHISTDEVYGSLEKHDPAFLETSNYEPNSPYSASKASSDHIVRAYAKTYGLPITLSNCSNNYGPYQHPEKLIPKIIACCNAKQAIPIYGDGSNIRDWLFVSEHCEAIYKIISQGQDGITYNIGGNTEKTNLEVAETICKYFNKNQVDDFNYLSLIEFVTDRPGHDWRYAINCERIKTSLGWEPQYSFEHGIEKTIAFYAHSKPHFAF